jgi:heterodisulfide reductase subunit A
MAETIKFKINGTETEVEKGTTILEAAEELGIHIPTLCYHPAVEPYQVCRVCLVEVVKNGWGKLVPACGHLAEEGTEVFTENERVLKRRRTIVELILAEAPNSERVRAIARELGIQKSRFEPKGGRECILCGLCVNVCNEVMGVGAISFANRGTRREVTVPYAEMSEVCSTCGACARVCPTGVIDLATISEHRVSPILSEFDAGLARRPCIYLPFPQAVPNKPVIDRENCMYFKAGTCRVCETVCQPGAIVYDQKEDIVEDEVGAVIVATGYDLYPIEKIPEYGSGRYEDVINGLQFERLLSASGPTEGEVRRPSDGKVPKRVAFISCVGSRDPEHHLPYCSKLCCMYMAKHALLYKEHVPDGEAMIFTIDVRTSGKKYEEFCSRSREEGDVVYVRGKPSRILREGDNLVVWAVNTLTGRHVRVECDMVVVSMAIVPSGDAVKVARQLRIPADEHGFLSEVHPKLRPVESLVRGFYLAGCSHAPKDIPESVAQASAAASKVLEVFSKKELPTEPMVAVVDEDLCVACKTCIDACPYDAREFDEQKKRVLVNEALCQGCGSCVVACAAGATQQKNLGDRQISRMVEVIFVEPEEPGGRNKP